MMKKLKIPLIAVGLITGNNILGHYLPPTSIFLTPVIITLIAALLSTANFRLYSKIIIVIAALISNDIAVKLTAGGIHDLEGQGWVNLFFIATVIISTIIVLSVWIYKDRRHWFYTTCFVLLIPISIWLYLSYFESLGLLYPKQASDSKEASIKNKVFLKNLQVSDNIVISKPDSIKILSGWAEKQVIINHQHLIKRYDDSSEVNYIVKLNGNKDFKNLNINWNVNDTSINGSSSADSIISFTCPKSAPAVTITFFKMTDRISTDTIIKTVTIY